MSLGHETVKSFTEVESCADAADMSILVDNKSTGKIIDNTLY
jgi:hypothetical protein